MARAAFKLRAELCERSFALVLDRGGMRRAWLHGRENIHKRYLLHVAGYNLGLLMRQLIGAGTPRGAADRLAVLLLAQIRPDGAFIALIIATDGLDAGALVILDLAPPPD